MVAGWPARGVLFGARRGQADALSEGVERDGRRGIFTCRLGFSNPTDWSLDGRFIVYRVNDPRIGGDLWILPMYGDRKPFPFQCTPFNETNARFSPNNRWVAFDSDESGRREVYVRRLEGSAEKSRFPRPAGRNPVGGETGKSCSTLRGQQNHGGFGQDGDTFSRAFPHHSSKLTQLEEFMQPWQGNTMSQATGNDSSSMWPLPRREACRLLSWSTGPRN